MKTVQLLLVIQLFNSLDVSSAIYKQWIPNTNFENSPNWDSNRIPCAQDTVYFDRSKKLSVFVQSAHSLTNMYLPWDGEFLLASGAGFSVAADIYDTGCGQGSDVTFRDADSYNWMDPHMWLAATSIDDLENGNYLFSVDEERVPCQYNDVIFQPGTSFRVNVEPSEGLVFLKSISILDQRFNRDVDFARYMETHTAKMQFHGSGSIKVTNTRCMDKTGCICGNSRELPSICTALMQHTDNKCPGVVCKDPLKPVGHCCEICGATVSLEYSPDFDMETYRNRLVHGFLSLEKYAGVRLAISKVYKTQTFLGIIPRQAVSEIQIVLTDDRNGSQTGTGAQLLASDIMRDVTDHGKSFGIVKGTVQIATGSNVSGLGGNGTASWTIAVSVVAFLLFLLLIGVLVFLYRRHGIRFPTFSVPIFWKTTYDLESISGPADKGFNNPMFDAETNATMPGPQGLYSGEEALKGISLKESGVCFVNPTYDENDSSI